jgi:primosomal protein N' (replication factor Y)
VTPAVARVLPDLPAVDRVFDYDASGSSPPAGIGDRVRVSLQGRSVRGWVVGVADRAERTGLKPLARRLGIGPPPSVVELCEWAAWRWAGPWSKLLSTASPPRVITKLPDAPPDTSAPQVHNQLRVVGQRLVRQGAATLVRVGPCTDPIELVLAMLHGVEATGATGSLIVTTPTTAWAQRLAERLAHRGVNAVGPDHWAAAAAGYPVVVGARAASLAPVPSLAAALVLDAHDGAYRQTQTPCWDAVTMLSERCRRAGAPLVATSWCPDPSLLALIRHIEETEHEARMWPRLVVADLSVADPRERQLSSTFANAAHRALAEPGLGARVVVVLQRLGGTRLMSCRACGALAVCEPHGLALREGAQGYGCAAGCVEHPRLCVRCGATTLRVLREGITSLTKRVSALLGVEAVEVSAATKELDGDARVVVGTEAVLTRVRHAGVVCFADLDDYLCAPRAHGSLEALRAIGLAGRIVGARGSNSPGSVVVQTRLATHPAVVAARRGEPAPLIAAEAAMARELGLPPHVAVCSLRGAGAAAFASALASSQITVTASADGFLAVAPSHRELCDALASTPRPHEPLRVEVDPRE